MEVNSDETFKYIPFRLYQGDEPFVQRLVKPVNEEGQRKTLSNFLQEIYAENASKGEWQNENLGHIITPCQ